MRVMLVIRDIEAGPRLRDRVEDLSSGLDRFFHDLRHVSWNLRRDAGAVKATCRLSARSGDYQAQASHKTGLGAIDLVYDKLVTQRRRVKKQTLGARRNAGGKG